MSYPTQADNYKQQYINNLNLQIVNNELVYNAVKMKNLKPVLPIKPPDNQTLEEKQNDIQGMLNSLRDNLVGLTDGVNSNQILDDIKNNIELLRFVTQTMPLIKEFIKKNYKAGINYMTFISYIEQQYEKNDNIIVAIQPLLQAQANQQVLVNNQVALQQQQANMKALQQAYLDEQERIRLQIIEDEKQRLRAIEKQKEQDAIDEQLRLDAEEQRLIAIEKQREEQLRLDLIMINEAKRVAQEEQKKREQDAIAQKQAEELDKLNEAKRIADEEQQKREKEALAKIQQKIEREKKRNDMAERVMNEIDIDLFDLIEEYLEDETMNELERRNKIEEATRKKELNRANYEKNKKEHIGKLDILEEEQRIFNEIMAEEQRKRDAEEIKNREKEKELIQEDIRNERVRLQSRQIELLKEMRILAIEKKKYPDLSKYIQTKKDMFGRVIQQAPTLQLTGAPVLQLTGAPVLQLTDAPKQSSYGDIDDDDEPMSTALVPSISTSLLITPNVSEIVNISSIPIPSLTKKNLFGMEVNKTPKEYEADMKKYEADVAAEIKQQDLDMRIQKGLEVEAKIKKIIQEQQWEQDLKDMDKTDAIILIKWLTALQLKNKKEFTKLDEGGEIDETQNKQNIVADLMVLQNIFTKLKDKYDFYTDKLNRGKDVSSIKNDKDLINVDKDAREIITNIAFKLRSEMNSKFVVADINDQKVMLNEILKGTFVPRRKYDIFLQQVELLKQEDVKKTNDAMKIVVLDVFNTDVNLNITKTADEKIRQEEKILNDNRERLKKIIIDKFNERKKIRQANKSVFSWWSKPTDMPDISNTSGKTEEEIIVDYGVYRMEEIDRLNETKNQQKKQLKALEQKNSNELMLLVNSERSTDNAKMETELKILRDEEEARKKTVNDEIVAIQTNITNLNNEVKELDKLDSRLDIELKVIENAIQKYITELSNVNIKNDTASTKRIKELDTISASLLDFPNQIESIRLKYVSDSNRLKEETKQIMSQGNYVSPTVVGNLTEITNELIPITKKYEKDVKEVNEPLQRYYLLMDRRNQPNYVETKKITNEIDNLRISNINIPNTLRILQLKYEKAIIDINNKISKITTETGKTLPLEQNSKLIQILSQEDKLKSKYDSDIRIKNNDYTNAQTNMEKKRNLHGQMLKEEDTKRNTLIETTNRMIENKNNEYKTQQILVDKQLADKNNKKTIILNKIKKLETDKNTLTQNERNMINHVKTEINNRKDTITKQTNTRVKKIEDARKLLLDNAYDNVLVEKNQQLTLIQNKLTTLDNKIGGYENEKQQIFQNEKMAIETSKQAQISSKKEEFAKKRALQEIENKRLDDERQKKFNSEFGISVIGYEETPEQRLLDEKLKKARAKDIYDTMYERNKDFINSATTDELESKLKENDILIDVYKEELNNPMNYFILKEKNGLLIEELSAVNQIINETIQKNDDETKMKKLYDIPAPTSGNQYNLHIPFRDKHEGSSIKELQQILQNLNKEIDKHIQDIVYNPEKLDQDTLDFIETDLLPYAKIQRQMILDLERIKTKKRPSIDETQPDIKSRRVDLEQRVIDETSHITGINVYKAFISNNNLNVDVGAEKFTKEFYKKNKKVLLEKLKQSVKDKIIDSGSDITFNKDLTQKK